MNGIITTIMIIGNITTNGILLGGILTGIEEIEKY